MNEKEELQQRLEDLSKWTLEAVECGNADRAFNRARRLARVGWTILGETK